MLLGFDAAKRLLVLTSLFGMAGCSSASTSHGICTIGSEGCACTSGGGCDGLLTCLSSVCVDNRADAGPLSGKPDATGWDVGPFDSTPPPPGCVTETYCAPNGGAAPCPSGYDCNAGLTPPRCVRLYCGTAGTACSEDVQCELGLICDRACTNDLTDRFVGSWKWTSGMGQWVCNGMTIPVDKPTEALIIVRGTAPIEVHFEGCVIRFDVVAGVARARPNQSCDDPEGTLAIDEFTLALQTGRTELVATERARVSVPSASPPQLCDYTMSGRLEKQ